MLLESAEVSRVEDISPDESEQVATILLVEDEERVREVVELTLRLSGYHVISTESAVKASQIIENYSDTIHLMITDFALPFMNGADLAARFRRARPGGKVLYISGFPKQDILESQGKGAKVAGEFLQKPFTPEALEDKIRVLLEGAD